MENFLIRRFGLALLVTGVLSAVSCQPADENVYTGRVIQIDFGNTEQIEAEAWIEVDGVRFTHAGEAMASVEDQNLLPATEVEHNDIRVPVNHHEITLQFISRLQSKMRQANVESEDGPVHHVEVVEDLQLFGASLVTLRSEEGEFTVRTSRNYGVPIQVVE